MSKLFKLILLVVLVVPFLASAEYTRFVFVICSYNNAEWYERNLDSLRMQDYPRESWRAIYLNDASKDDTAALVVDYIKRYGLEQNFIVINNQRNRGPMANQYKAFHMCEDDEVIILLDGDDWLWGPDVLAYLNTIYQDPNVWMTYGGYQKWPSGDRGLYVEIPQDIIDTNAYNRYGRMTTHLRSGYAWLHKQIKLEDLLYEGKFLRMSSDVAVMLRMFEMCGGKFKYINDRYVHVYNTGNPLSEHRIDMDFQEAMDRYARSRPVYTAKSLQDKYSMQEPRIGIVVFNEATVPSSLKTQVSRILKLEPTLDQEVIKIVLDNFVRDGDLTHVLVVRDSSYFAEKSLENAARLLTKTHVPAYFFAGLSDDQKLVLEEIENGAYVFDFRLNKDLSNSNCPVLLSSTCLIEGFCWDVRQLLKDHVCLIQ